MGSWRRMRVGRESSGTVDRVALWTHMGLPSSRNPQLRLRIDSELGVGTTVKIYLPKSSDRPVTADIDTEGTSLEPVGSDETDIGGGGRRGRSRCRIRESGLSGRDRSERHAGTRVLRGRPTSRRVAFGRDYAWRHEWRAARCRGARKEPSEAADQKPESDPPSESSRRSSRCFTVGRASGL